MRKSSTYKILAAVMAAGSLGLYAAAPTEAKEFNAPEDGTIVNEVNEKFDNVYGNGTPITITAGTIGYVYGVGEYYYNDDASGGNVTINGNAKVAYVYGGMSAGGSAHHNTVNISDGTVTGYVFGGESISGNAHHNTVNISGDSVTSSVCGGRSTDGSAHHNTVNISGGTVRGEVYGGDSHDVQAHHNIVNISGGSVTNDVYGGWSTSSSAHHNTVNISGGTIGEANDIVNIYGGRSPSGSAKDNQIIIRGSADIENANLYGSYNAHGTGNTLTIDGWSDSTQSVQNFNDIAFKNISWDYDGTVLTITAGSADDLKNTNIKTINIAGGSNINVGKSMTLIDGNISSIGDVTDTFTAGVALEGTGTTSVDNEGNVSFTVNDLKASSQAVSAAQSRAASAAFVNQGTDLISDSLDTISRDDNYGVKTFAAVHGNRSKYDVADDIKINGWSTIVGVGNADKFDNGSEFSWGVFYENGSGNYRTYNSFNNEYFRGDGSMVYNGGGIAARYENKNGVYTEGSLRAGRLRNRKCLLRRTHWRW